MNRIVKNNFFALLILSGLTIALQTQAQVKLNGKLAGLNADSMSFVYTVNGSEHNDRVAVKNESFSWHAMIDSPVLVTMKIPFSTEYIDYPFFAEPGAMQLRGGTGNLDSLLNIRISGSPTQDLFQSYVRDRLKLINESIVLEEQLAKSKPDSVEILHQKITGIEQMIKAGLAEKYIRANPKSFASLHLVHLLVGSRLDYDTANSLFESLDQSVKSSSAAGLTKKELNILQRSARGQQLKSFSIPDMDGKTVTLADYKGKILLVDFWASWCVPCRQENPNLLKNYDKYHAKGFNILGISCDTDNAKWKKAVNEDKLPWKQVRDWEILKYYGLQSIPSNFLVDGNRTILGINLTGEALTQKLDEIFSKQNNPS